jgi:hypothetical protein
VDFDDLDPIQRQILGVAVEDWFALWEVAATQEVPPADRVDQAREGIRQLLELGFVELARFTWPDGEHAPASTATLDDPDEWAPERPDYVIVGATEAGKMLYLVTE